MALPMRLLVPALAAVLLAAGCGQGTKTSAGKFSGEQKVVATTIDDLQSAGRKGDAQKICSDLLAPSLLQQIRRASGDCAKTLDGALQDVDSFGMTVEKVAINGNQATATVKSDAGNSSRTDQIQLQKVGSNWKIASLGG